jgi:hypothetical protein
MATVGKATGVFEEKIRARAYQIWMQEGCPEGREAAHWQQAEVELAVARSRPPRRKRTSTE